MQIQKLLSLAYMHQFLTKVLAILMVNVLAKMEVSGQREWGRSVGRG